MKLAVVGNPGFIDRSYEVPTKTLFARCGNNTGNLVFWYAFNTHIKESTRTYLGFHFNPDVVNAQDAMVFILANHLNPNMDLGPIADRLEKVTVPVLSLGLGLQIPLGIDFPTLPEGSQRFFKLLSEKAEVIGLRGEATQSALADMGIHNTEVIGCISSFITPNLEELFARPCEPKKHHRVLVNNDFTNAALPVNSWLAKQSSTTHSDFVVQAPVELLHLARNEPENVDEAFKLKERKVMAPFISNGRSIEDVYANTHAFYDTRAWLEHAKRFDVAIGTRMHGNMASLQTGVPTYFYVHDARTSELCDTMQLPKITEEDLANFADINELIYAFDPTNYFNCRSALAARYKQLLLNFGLQPTRLLETIQG